MITPEERKRLRELDKKALQSFSIETRRDITDEYVSIIEGRDPKTYKDFFIAQCDERVSDETWDLIIESRNQIIPLLDALESSEDRERIAVEELRLCLADFDYFRNSHMGWLTVPEKAIMRINTALSAIEHLKGTEQ